MEDLQPHLPPERRALLRRALRWLREAMETVLPAVLIALLINLFLAQATRVQGQSMEPNLHANQRLVVEKISYRFHKPRRGDVVVLKCSAQGELLIKRVVALPGEQVEIKGGQLYVNGCALDEPYPTQPSSHDYGPTVVPPRHVFVLGDNRSFSNDSRAFGPVPFENIVGRAWFSYWPPDEMGPVD